MIRWLTLSVVVAHGISISLSAHQVLPQPIHIPHISSKRTPEVALEPELPIIDPHHNFYSHYSNHYMLAELNMDIARAGHNITKTVFIESHSSNTVADVVAVAEIALAQRIAEQAAATLNTKIAAGIIGTADLLDDGFEDSLQRDLRASPNFRGVRYRGGRSEFIPFDNPKLSDSLDIMARLGLVFEINGPERHPLNFTRVLGGIVSLARAHPSLTIVVDHLGGAVGPTAFDGQRYRWQDWQLGLVKLAMLPNVMMKIGGLGMEKCGFPLGPSSRTTRVGSEELAMLTLPYYEPVISAFTPQRCMFESNFPDEKWGVDYDVVWNTFKRIAAKMRLSADEKAAIFHDTAARVYNISST